MRVIEAKRTDFKHEGECWLVYSRPKFDMEKGEYGPEDGPLVVSLFGPGCEISVEALTHGEGMVILADVMKSLGKKLAMEAFEKEGAFKNPLYRGDR